MDQDGQLMIVRRDDDGADVEPNLIALFRSDCQVLSRWEVAALRGLDRIATALANDATFGVPAPHDLEAPFPEYLARAIAENRRRGLVPQHDLLVTVDHEDAIGGVGDEPVNVVHDALLDSVATKTPVLILGEAGCGSLDGVGQILSNRKGNVY
jgi:hypothetical protein